MASHLETLGQHIVRQGRPVRFRTNKPKRESGTDIALARVMLMLLAADMAAERDGEHGA